MSEADERTPLLDESDRDDDRPLPLGQISLLCLARLLEPIAFFSLFSFVNQMIKDMNEIETPKIGFVSGLIESSFSAVQVFCLVPWGKMSDTIGRKPILIVSLLAVGASVAALGFSQHIWQLLLCRMVSGMFSSAVVTIRASLAELSTPKTQARAFAWFGFTTNLGLFLGPVVGGTLSRPAMQFPHVFGGIQLFIDFPYCLPGLVMGVVAVILAALLACFLQETLPPLEQRQTAAETNDTSMKAILRLPGVLQVFGVTATVMSLGFSFTAMLPLFAFTPTHMGGLGFDPPRIAFIIAASGLAQAGWILVVFPPLQRRIGTVAVLRWCCYLWPLFFALNGPVANALRRLDVDSLFWTLFLPIIILGTGVAMAFTCVQMCINHICPSPLLLGALTGWSTSIASAVRIFIPALASSSYALGVKWGRLQGQAGWLFPLAIALLQIPLVRRLPRTADSKPIA